VTQPSYQATGLWRDVGELPELLQATLDQEQDPRLSPITSFPSFTALAIDRGFRKGLKVDNPDWLEIYNATARAKMGER
jgi:hypothetical protein